MTSLLVITDTQEELDLFRNKNKQFIPGLNWCTKTRLEGSTIIFRFATINTLEAVTCGIHIDAIINLSSSDTERFRDLVIPCLM